MRKILIALTVLLLNSAGKAEDSIQGGAMCLGINYPGIELKYFLNSKNAVELRYQASDEISVAGIRWYRCSLKSSSDLSLFYGFEAGGISFKGDDSEGTGIMGGLYLGGEYFIGKRLGLIMDIGPYYISLSDADYSVTESGIAFVVNLGLNFYFKK